MKKSFSIAQAGLAIIVLAASATAFAQNAGDAVYRALGGKPGIEKVIAEFMPIVLADARIKEAFKDADIDRIRKMLAEQFCVLAGGPCKYTGKDMETIHADLKITNAQFNALAEDLQIAMEKQGVPSSAQNKLVAKLAPMQRDIVTK